MSSGTPRAGRLRNACLIAAIVGIVLLVVTGAPKRPSLAALVPVRLAVRARTVAGQPRLGRRPQSDGRALGTGRAAVRASCAALVSIVRAAGGTAAIAPAQLLPWMNTNAGAEGAGLAAGQHWYLNSSFFYLRGVVYFVVWLGLARLLRDDAARRPRQGVAAIGFVLYALTTTFAAVDWTMSLTPPWHSTVFGLLIGTGQALAALAGAIVCANALSMRSRCAAARALPRSRQSVARARARVDLFGAHAVPDHVDRGSARRDHLDVAAHPDELERTHLVSGVHAFPAAVRAAAVARREARTRRARRRSARSCSSPASPTASGSSCRTSGRKASHCNGATWARCSRLAGCGWAA